MRPLGSGSSDRTAGRGLKANQRNLSRRIQLCQRLLGQTQTPGDLLMARSLDELQSLADQLEQQLPDP